MSLFNFSGCRDVPITLYPLNVKNIAHVNPIPLDAPVINTFSLIKILSPIKDVSVNYTNYCFCFTNNAVLPREGVSLENSHNHITS